MFCQRCSNHVTDCTCGDIEERLASLSEHPNFETDRCGGCQEHPSDCTCDEYVPTAAGGGE